MWSVPFVLVGLGFRLSAAALLWKRCGHYNNRENQFSAFHSSFFARFNDCGVMKMSAGIGDEAGGVWFWL